MGKKIVHVEFPAKDADRGERFWEGLGGWTLENPGMAGMDYRMFQDDGWGDAAGTEATGRQERQLAVRRRRTGADLRRFRHGGEQRVGALDVACRAGTDDAGVLALRLECEEVIKSRNSIHTT